MVPGPWYPICVKDDIDIHCPRLGRSKPNDNLMGEISICHCTCVAPLYTPRSTQGWANWTCSQRMNCYHTGFAFCALIPKKVVFVKSIKKWFILMFATQGSRNLKGCIISCIDVTFLTKISVFTFRAFWKHEHIVPTHYVQCLSLKSYTATLPCR